VHRLANRHHFTGFADTGQLRDTRAGSGQTEDGRGIGKIIGIDVVDFRLNLSPACPGVYFSMTSACAVATCKALPML